VIGGDGPGRRRWLWTGAVPGSYPHLPHSAPLLHTAVGDVRTYRVHYIVTAPACHPSKVLTLLLFLLVQHASCKLREGAVRSAYCSEVVRHGGSLYQSEGEWLHFMEEWKNGREEKKSSGGRASARTAYI
jgi:hypothetical protein